MFAPKPWWPYARTANRVAKDTVERHTFNSACERIALYAEVECFVKLGDGTVTIGAYNENDVLRIPPGRPVHISLVGWAVAAADKTYTTLAMRAPVDCRLQIVEYDNPGVDAGADGGSY